MAAILVITRQLEPFAGRLAVGGMSALFLGSVGHRVGELALLTGDEDTGLTHLRSALELHERLGFLPFARATEALLSGGGRGTPTGQTGPPGLL